MKTITYTATKSVEVKGKMFNKGDLIFLRENDEVPAGVELYDPASVTGSKAEPKKAPLSKAGAKSGEAKVRRTRKARKAEEEAPVEEEEPVNVPDDEDEDDDD